VTYDRDDARRDEYHDQMRREVSVEILADANAERLKRMSVTIFYSWQSDTPNNLNRGFIDKALKKSIKLAGASADVQQAVRDGELEVDRDTQGVAGTPPIAEVIFQKIGKCSVFVPDFTFSAKSGKGRLVPNPNVLIEYGWAVRDIGYDRMLPVMNTAFGAPEGNLPFDMRHLRHPITYDLGAGTPAEESARVGDLLAKELAEAIELILKAHGPRGDAAPAPEPPSFPPQPATLGPSQFWGQMEPFATLQNDSTVGFRFDDHAERLFLRVIPTTPIDRIKPAEAMRLVAAQGRLDVMSNDARSANLARNRFGVAMCAYELLETDPKWGIVTNASQLFLTRELWGLDAWTINSKRLKEKANVKFGYFPSVVFERAFVKTLANYLDFANRTLKVPPPLKFIAGATNVEGYRMSRPDAEGYFDGNSVERNIVYEGEIRDYSENPTNILRPFFESVWETCGLERPANIS
jgi:hypothetical protein